MVKLMSRTVENLTKAFIGESQARNRYTLYSKQATKDGYPEIAEIFLKTAENEREHAKWLFRLINQIKENDDDIAVEAEASTILGDTATNLKASIAGEHYEASQMYPTFAKIAREEGHDDIADRLEHIGQAEQHHESRYKELLKNVENGTLFSKDKPVTWECMKCGYVSKGEEPPKKCPSCDHPTKYFEILCDLF
ncbi:rubrerythrin-1 [Methanobrevibacter cuticularis]|uniref:Rubrerythrin-1 n=1 Tax=Methanobrevibacter cuticularis TaxID=47311 RepID=A0A166EDU3_9EURY|nr:rubrerythrin family protein [Methanobrevibacter cuticularis]KZX16543.1 rubrerythrin-1 [Methanobrevibacter cuticularis]